MLKLRETRNKNEKFLANQNKEEKSEEKRKYVSIYLWNSFKE